MPNEQIVLYTNPMSRGRIARWMLEETGQPYRAEVLEYGAAMKSPQYLAINPMGKVPAIVHGGVVVTECAAICAWLADAFPEAGLAPAPGDPLRGPYYRWLFFAAGPLEAAVTAKSLGLLAPAEKSGMAGYGSYEQTVDALETVVAGAVAAGRTLQRRRRLCRQPGGVGPAVRQLAGAPGLRRVRRPPAGA